MMDKLRRFWKWFCRPVEPADLFRFNLMVWFFSCLTLVICHFVRAVFLRG